MNDSNDSEIQRALGRLEGTVGQIEKKQTAMCKDVKAIRKDITKLKIRTYSISGVISAVSGGITGFFGQMIK